MTGWQDAAGRYVDSLGELDALDRARVGLLGILTGKLDLMPTSGPVWEPDASVPLEAALARMTDELAGAVDSLMHSKGPEAYSAYRLQTEHLDAALTRFIEQGEDVLDEMLTRAGQVGEMIEAVDDPDWIDEVISETLRP